MKFLNGNINFFQLLRVIIILPKKEIFISAFEIIKKKFYQMKAIDLKIFIISIIFFFIFINFFEGLIYFNFYNQLILFSIPLIWPGLAHGSIDIFTAKRFNLIQSNKSLIFFLIIYISIPILFFYFWLKFPTYFSYFFNSIWFTFWN